MDYYPVYWKYIRNKRNKEEYKSYLASKTGNLKKKNLEKKSNARGVTTRFNLLTKRLKLRIQIDILSTEDTDRYPVLDNFNLFYFSGIKIVS